MQKEFWWVDAFTTERFKGNPCAVVFDAAGLTTVQMQTIAAETNLSETVFVLPPTEPDADYLARIFTPRTELPFAGHPTLSTAFSMLGSGRVSLPTDRILRQQCGAGIVEVEVDAADQQYTMTQPQPRFRDLDIELGEIASVLRIDAADLSAPPQAVSTGIYWLVVATNSPQALGSIKPDYEAVARVTQRLRVVGLAPFSLGALATDCQVKVRAFVPGEAIAEDPVTGSANGCIGAYIARQKLMSGESTSYWAEQGTEIQREGRVHVSCTPIDDSWRVRVGGCAVKVMSGHLWV